MGFFRRLFGWRKGMVQQSVTAIDLGPDEPAPSPPTPPRSIQLSEGKGKNNEDERWRRFRPITHDPKRDLSPIRQERMCDIARHHWQSNAIAKRGILNLRSFIASDGFKVRSLATKGENRARVQRFLDRWWKKNEWDEQLSKRVETLLVEGEWFYWEAPPDAEGISELRKILPENVRHVERDRLNAERLTKVVLKDPLKIEIGQSWYSKHHLRIIDECYPDGDVHYLQINALSGQTRGLSDLLVVSDWLDYLDALTFAEIERVQVQKNYSWFVKLATDKENDILAKRGELAAEGPPPPGSVKVIGEGEDWEIKSPNFQLGDSAEFIKLIMLICFGGLIMPEHYFSSGGDVNKATSAKMDTPVFAFTRDRKNLIQGFLRRAIARAIRCGVRAGTLAGIPVSELGFEVVSRDPDRSAYDLIGDMLTRLGQALKLGQEQGYFSDVEAARAFRSAASGLGLGDFQAINEESLSQARERVRLRLEDQAGQLKQIFPVALESRPTEAWIEAENEDDEKKNLINELVGVAREQAESARLAQTDAEEFGVAIWEEVTAELARHGRDGGQLEEKDINDVMKRLEPRFTDLFPATRTGSAVDRGRRNVGLLMPGERLDGTRMIVPRPGREPEPWSLERRVLNTTVKEPDPDVSRSIGGRRRSLGREVQYSQAYWAKNDVHDEILRRLEKAKADGKTSLEDFARELSQDESLAKETAKSVARNVAHNEQRAAKFAEDLLYQDIAEDSPEGLKMCYVRVAAENPCSKCDPLDGGTFDVSDGVERKKYSIPQHKACRCTWVPALALDRFGAGFASELSDALAAVRTIHPPVDALEVDDDSRFSGLDQVADVSDTSFLADDGGIGYDEKPDETLLADVKEVIVRGDIEIPVYKFIPGSGELERVENGLRRYHEQALDGLSVEFTNEHLSSVRGGKEKKSTAHHEHWQIGGTVLSKMRLSRDGNRDYRNSKFPLQEMLAELTIGHEAAHHVFKKSWYGDRVLVNDWVSAMKSDLRLISQRLENDPLDGGDLEAFATIKGIVGLDLERYFKVYDERFARMVERYLGDTESFEAYFPETVAIFKRFLK